MMQQPIATVVGYVRSINGQYLNLRSGDRVIAASANAHLSVVALVKYQRSKSEYTFVNCATERDYQKFLERGYEEVLRIEPLSEAEE